MGDVKDDLQPVQRRRKCRNDQSALGLLKYLFKRRNDRHLRRRPARHGRVGRIAQQGEHTVVADASERFEVVRFADNGRVVDLVITRVDDGADRRVNGERKTLDQRV